MSILVFLLVGIIAGWITGLLMKGSGYGIVGDMVLGVVGAVIGGWIFSLFNLPAYGVIGSIIMSVIGAVILVVIVRSIRSSGMTTR